MAGILFIALCLLLCPSPLSLLLAAAVHEAGHLTVAAILGWERPRAALSPFGLRLEYRAHHRCPESIAVALGGSIFGLLATLLPFLPRALRFYSLGFALINLLPVQGLDGGGALLALLELFCLPDRAFFAAERVSLITVLLIWLCVTAAELKLGVNLPVLLATVYLTAVSLSKKGGRRS